MPIFIQPLFCFSLQLQIHASYQTTTALVTKTHVGKAINAKYGDDGKESIIQAVYYMPFLVTLIIVLVSIICVCVFECLKEDTTEKSNDDFVQSHIELKCFGLTCLRLTHSRKHLLNNYKRTIKKLKSQFSRNLQSQSNLVAITLLCILFPIYTFVLDMCSVEREENANLPDYFKEGYYGLHAITISFATISLLCDLIGIIGFIIVRCHNHFWKHNYGCSIKRKWDYFIPMLFCIGSTFLSISFHFQNILIAWFTDPFYAGRIALFYGIVIFCYFTSLKYIYLLPYKILGTEDHPNSSSVLRILISILLLITIVVCTGTIAAVTLFFVEIANNNSVEQSITGITTIYNGAVILVGVLIAYSVGVHYFEYPFSLENALKKAMEEMNAPLNFNPDNRVWKKLTEEKRMTEVMKAFIHEQSFSRFCSLRSTLTSVLIKANKQHYFIAPPDQIVTISTVLHDAMNNAVRTFAEERNVNISTVTDALVEVMNKPQFLLQHNYIQDYYIDLSETPTGGMLTMLQNDLTNSMHVQDETVSVNPDKLRMCLIIALIPLPSILANIIRNSELIRDFMEDYKSTTTYNAINSAVRTAAENDISNIYRLTGVLVEVIHNPQFVPTDHNKTTEESLATLTESLKERLGSENEPNVDADIKKALENILHNGIAG